MDSIQPSRPWYQVFVDLSTDLSSVLIGESKSNFLLTPNEALEPVSTLTRLQFAEIAKRALDIRDCIATRQDLNLPIEDTWPDQSIDPIQETQNKLSKLSPELELSKTQIQELASLISQAQSEANISDNNQTPDSLSTSIPQAGISDQLSQIDNTVSQNTDQTSQPEKRDSDAKTDIQIINPDSRSAISNQDTQADSTPDGNISSNQNQSQDSNQSRTDQGSTPPKAEQSGAASVSQSLTDEQVQEQVSELLDTIQQALQTDDPELEREVDAQLPPESVVVEDIACTTCPCEYTIDENEVFKPTDEYFVILRNKEKSQILDQSNKVSPSQ